MNNNSIKIIRSAISSMPSVSIIKLLKEYGFWIIGTDIVSESAGLQFVDNYERVPAATEDQKNVVVSRYLDIIKKYDVSWIISGPENEVIQLAESTDNINNLNCKLLHPSFSSLKIVTDKLSLYTSSKTIVPLKRTVYFEDKKSLNELEGEKVVLKPRMGRGSSGVFIVNRKDERFMERASSINQNYVAQEFISGKEYSVDVLCDLEGSLMNLVVRERVSVESGISVVSRTVKIDKIIEYTIAFLQKIKLAGFNCIQFIEENGEYYLTDVNPRIGGGSILSLKSSKVFEANFIKLLKMNLEDIEYMSLDYKEKTMYRYYSEVYV